MNSSALKRGYHRRYFPALLQFDEYLKRRFILLEATLQGQGSSATTRAVPDYFP